MGEELKPCPWCGKQPRVCPDNSYGAAMVYCPDEHECPVQPVADADWRDGDALNKAITAWNTRTQSTRLAELEEALSNALEEAANVCFDRARALEDEARTFTNRTAILIQQGMVTKFRQVGDTIRASSVLSKGED